MLGELILRSQLQKLVAKSINFDLCTHIRNIYDWHGRNMYAWTGGGQNYVVHPKESNPAVFLLLEACYPTTENRVWKAKRLCLVSEWVCCISSTAQLPTHEHSTASRGSTDAAFTGVPLLSVTFPESLSRTLVILISTLCLCLKSILFSSGLSSISKLMFTR